MRYALTTKTPVMRKFIFASLLALVSISAFAQPNMACYRDTAMVDENIYRKDTVWSVKTSFQSGDWNLYYDFGLTKIKSEYHYTDKGVKTGIWKEYFKNGSVRSEFDYNTPLVPLFPPGKEWYANGKVKIERTQTADTLTETQYYPSGKVSAYKKWDKNAMWVLHREWCENGQLTLDYNPTVASPAPVKRYYCNGSIKAEYNWYAYGYTGAYKEYHDNGKVSIQGQFTEKPTDVAVYMARKTGTWTFYDEKGKVTKKEIWENGKLIKTEK
jgi:antitoxin component YwqK of YwqJK toxin-antitoxin module